MKIYFTLLYVIAVLVIQNSVFGKSIIFNKYSKGPHFDVQKQEDISFDDSKENLEKDNVEALINSYKRSADEINFKPLKRSLFEGVVRKRSPYGLVYNQGKPIGILEPIAQSFEYSNYGPRDASCRNGLYKSQWFPVKRESELDMDEMEKDQLESQTSALHSSNYANVLAKFKVNNKVKHRPYQDYLNSQTKRATVQDISRRKEIDDLRKRGALDMGDLKANMKTKINENLAIDKSSNKAETSKIDEIEENIKDVMGDMGLVEKDKEAQTSEYNDGSVKKREIYFEDEDLENGLNKIGLTKESHNDRNKKEDCPGKTKVAKSKGSRKIGAEKNIHKKGKKKVRKDDDPSSKRSIKSGRKRIAEKKDMSSSDVKTKVANYQYEGEEFIRRKRQEKEAEKTEDPEIMKGLETSGDLTVSGNKSPLVAVSNADDVDSKKSEEKRDKEELDYEKRLERNIQEKINAIKEEVKREIGKIKTEDVKKDQQRRKREITNTLLDEETSILDPDLNIDQKLEPHIRKRRDLPKGVSTNSEESNHKRESNSNKEKDAVSKGNAKSNVVNKKAIRETVKNAASKSTVNTQEQTNEKVKRSEVNAGGIKKTAEGKSVDQTVNKREDKLTKTGKDSVTHAKQSSSKHLTKRNSEEMVSKNDASEDNLLNSKNVEKRNDAFTATDKIETDNKAEFGTDMPESIVKRSDQTAAPINVNQAKVDTIMLEAANIVKRNEQYLETSTTDKCIENTVTSKSLDAKDTVDTEMREDRSAVNKITDLETGQTLVNLDSDSDEQRQLGNEKANNIADAKITDELTGTNEEQDDAREERGVKNKADKQDTSATHKTRRAIDSEENENDIIKSSVAEGNSVDNLVEEGKSNVINSEENNSALTEDAKDENAKQGDSSELSDDSVIEERSVDTRKEETDTSDDAINERSAYRKQNISSVYADAELIDSSDVERDARRAANKSMNPQELNNEDNNLNVELNEEMVNERRRKRKAVNLRNKNRRKRDESSYSENKEELNNYRADNDGEIDEEDDEMHDDGFDDQTSNFMNKRDADYDNENMEANEEQGLNDDYPVYMERNKRNALRMYDDENDAEESRGNFLFYPNKYSRTKRHNYDNLVALHGGGMTNHAAALRERNKQSHEQNLRRKRLEKLSRMHDDNGNAELSESDIFGGFPQSYEGELSRFKRVKRSYFQ